MNFAIEKIHVIFCRYSLQNKPYSCVILHNVLRASKFCTRTTQLPTVCTRYSRYSVEKYCYLVTYYYNSTINSTTVQYLVTTVMYSTSTRYRTPEYANKTLKGGEVLNHHRKNVLSLMVRYK